MQESCASNDSLGHIPVWGSWVGCNLHFFLGQHCVFTYAEPKLRHIESRIPRPNSRHLLSNNFFSFKTAQNDYHIFCKYFSITRSQEQTVQIIHKYCDYYRSWDHWYYICPNLKPYMESQKPCLLQTLSNGNSRRANLQSQLAHEPFTPIQPFLQISETHIYMHIKICRKRTPFHIHPYTHIHTPTNTQANKRQLNMCTKSAVSKVMFDWHWNKK